MSNNKDFKEYKSIFKRVLTVLSWTAFSLLMIIGAFLIYYVVSAQIYARKGEEYKPPFSLYTIVSPSMEPKIKTYDVIFNINYKEPSEIKKGDIITFVSSSALTNGMIITHRVIDIVKEDEKLLFRTKGDNNKTPDVGFQSEESILGITVLKIPQLGRIQFFLASRGGWIFAIMIPAAGVIIYDIMRIFKLVGVKNKIDKITDDNPPKPDEKKSKKEKNLKSILKRKFVLEDELPKKAAPPEKTDDKHSDFVDLTIDRTDEKTSEISLDNNFEEKTESSPKKPKIEIDFIDEED